VVEQYLAISKSLDCNGEAKKKIEMQIAISSNFVGVFVPLPDLHNSLS